MSSKEAPLLKHQEQRPRNDDGMLVCLQDARHDEWDINPDELCIAKTEDGDDHVLGSGGFGVVRRPLRLSAGLKLPVCPPVLLEYDEHGRLDSSSLLSCTT